jgi:hypothetical protein
MKNVRRRTQNINDGREGKGSGKGEGGKKRKSYIN